MKFVLFVVIVWDFFENTPKWCDLRDQHAHFDLNLIELIYSSWFCSLLNYKRGGGGGTYSIIFKLCLYLCQCLYPSQVDMVLKGMGYKWSVFESVVFKCFTLTEINANNTKQYKKKKRISYSGTMSRQNGRDHHHYFSLTEICLERTISTRTIL